MAKNSDDQAFILDRCEPEPNTGCWLWLDALTPKGYGRPLRRGLRKLAHRLAYEAFLGAVPDGMQLDHHCRVRCCVNPRHLRPVTARENTHAAGSLALAKAHAEKTHCIHGHPLAGDNLMRRGARWRDCRECTRARQRKASKHA